MKIRGTIVIAIVLGLQCACTKSNSGSKSVSNLKRNPVLEFLILAEDGKFNKDLLATTEIPSAGAKPNDLVKDANGVTIGRWVALAREYAPDKEADQRAFKFVPFRDNFIRDGSTEKLIDFETFALGTDSEQNSNNFKAWLDARKISSVQILCKQPLNDELVTGQHFQSARSTIDQMGRPCVAFTMTSEGADNIHKLTSVHQGQRLGILFRNELHSAPIIESPIPKNGRITGDFTQEEVDDMVIILSR